MLSLKKKNFGKLPDGTNIDIYTIRNNNGLEFSITNYGARITSILVPDSLGKFQNVVLGFDNLDDYIKDEFYLGAIIGRYANRISKGKFRLGEKEYELNINNGNNHLHGGSKGFDKVVWDVKEINEENQKGIKLYYKSEDGEEGYPGNLDVEVSIDLSEENELIISYNATSDKPTPINLTHHGYFNLSGDLNNSILSHELKINSDEILENNSDSMPTGNFINVNSTPFNFKKFRKIEDQIYQENIQLKYGNGYDHCYVFQNNNILKKVAKLLEPVSGRLMEIYTSEPAMQFYTGNFLSKEKTNEKFKKRTGLCLETQRLPNSPNKSKFPSSILNPGSQYQTKTIYKFLIK